MSSTTRDLRVSPTGPRAQTFITKINPKHLQPWTFASETGISQHATSLLIRRSLSLMMFTFIIAPPIIQEAVMKV